MYKRPTEALRLLDRALSAKLHAKDIEGDGKWLMESVRQYV